MVPLLKIKLRIPRPRPNLVSRPRLTAQLSQGVARPVTLISASAGFGKTTLIAEWIGNAKIPVAWLSLDGGDNDLARLLAYLIGALQTICPSVGQAGMGMLDDWHMPLAEAVLTSVLNDVADADRDLALVFDDYHLVETETIHNAVTFLIDHLPPAMHLIIATRADPPLPIARLRARGQLLEIRQSDLQFTREEAALFFKQTLGRDLAASHTATLAARTEGWIAGLQMAAVSLEGRDDAASDLLQYIVKSAAAHFAIARGQSDEAFEHLNALLVSAERNGLYGYVIETEILRALAFHAQGSTDQATRALFHALTLAEPEGYVTTFVNAGTGVRQLLEGMLAGMPPSGNGDARMADYVRMLVATFEATSPHSVENVPKPAKAMSGPLQADLGPTSVNSLSLVEPLSRREVEVLQLVAAGLSNKAIARRLVITDETVKKHLRNVYGKLQAHSRTQAIAQARQLRIL